MKKLLSLLTGLLLVFVIVGSASALSYSEEFSSNEWFNSANASHTWTFDLDNDNLGSGDINAEDTINSAYFSIGFYDDERDRWNNTGSYEYGDLFVGGYTLFSSEIDNNDDYSWDLTAYLADHTLSVTVNWILGDFGVDFTSLWGDYTDNPVASATTASPVPEPATLLLFGFGILGAARVGRKKRQK